MHDENVLVTAIADAANMKITRVITLLSLLLIFIGIPFYKNNLYQLLLLKTGKVSNFLGVLSEMFFKRKLKKLPQAYVEQ